MLRKDGRRSDQIRPVKIKRNYLKHADGSALITIGNTQILCAASIDEKVPPFLRDKGQGWITAEYSMFPRATSTRTIRDRVKVSGRTYEIQRLIGRALRGAIDLKLLGERTIFIDCDVIQADGGTRAGAITGGFVALVDALIKLEKQGNINCLPINNYIAAISVGIVKGKPLLDISYQEDVEAAVDMNVVMTDSGRFVEIQGTGEEATFSKNDMDKLINLARKGINELIKIQRATLKKRV